MDHDTVLDPKSDSTLTSSAFDATAAAPSAIAPAASVTPESLRSTRPSVLPRVLAEGDQLRLVHEAVARYRALKKIGEGGMGEVEKAEDVDIGRAVAIKRLLPDAASASNVVRFVQEVRIVGNLEHPNVVPLHDVGLDQNGRYFFVMKYVDGESLEQIIERLRAGDPNAVREYTHERRIQIFLGVVRALEYAHAQGIVHRDIKPANVMVGRYGEVWLMDWGIAKRLGQREGSGGARSSSDEVKTEGATPDDSQRNVDDIRTTRHGAIMGTPAYMAPEQARGDLDAVDARTDIYSACVLFHELVTGHHYLEHKSGSLAQVLEAVISFKPTVPDLHAPGSPAELIHFSRRGLAKEKSERWQSATEMVQELENILEGKIRVQCPFTLTKRVTRETSRFVDRHPWPAFLMLVSSALAVIAGFGALALRLFQQANVH